VQSSVIDVDGLDVIGDLLDAHVADTVAVAAARAFVAVLLQLQASRPGKQVMQRAHRTKETEKTLLDERTHQNSPVTDMPSAVMIIDVCSKNADRELRDVPVNHRLEPCAPDKSGRTADSCRGKKGRRRHRAESGSSTPAAVFHLGQLFKLVLAVARIADAKAAAVAR